MFLIHILYVKIVGFNGKMYKGRSRILLYTFIRLKNTLPNRKETTFIVKRFQVSACSCQEEGKWINP